jgi:hypothetical protein
MAIPILTDMVNTRAIERYGEFVGAMDMVAEALESADKLIAQVDDKRGAGGFTLPTQDELKALRLKAFHALDILRTKAKQHEGDLVSRAWKV